MRGLLAEALAPLVAVSVAVYLGAAVWLGVDPRWAWFAFPLLFAGFLWRQGRLVLGGCALLYLYAYYRFVGSGAVALLEDDRGLAAVAVPAGCLILQVAGLTVFWVGRHIKNGE